MKLFIFLVFIISFDSFADEFSDLKKNQAETFSKDPFANNKSSCVATTARGVKLTESWSFFNTPEGGKYLKHNSPAVQKGTYTYTDGNLKIKQTSSVVANKENLEVKENEYPVKLVANGYEYILTNKMGEKILYSCAWSGSSVK